MTPDDAVNLTAAAGVSAAANAVARKILEAKLRPISEDLARRGVPFDQAVAHLHAIADVFWTGYGNGYATAIGDHGTHGKN